MIRARVLMIALTAAAFLLGTVSDLTAQGHNRKTHRQDEP